jgi:hypothetical protein
MTTTVRPWTVSVSGWIIIVTSVLFFLISLVRFPRSAHLLVFVFFLAGLMFWVARFLLGLAIMRGLNWGRIAYLIFDLIVVNAPLFADEAPVMASQPSWLAHIPWLPIVLYSIALVLLTRKKSLEYYGRPTFPRVRKLHVVLVLFLISLAMSGVSSVAYRMGATRLPAIADYMNPVDLLRNTLADVPALAFLETGHYRDVKKMGQAINQSKSLAELGDIANSESYQNVTWANDNNVFVAGVGLVSLIGVILILRHP